mmetsp:Transcript_50934/g.114584  ORF Transcript_50934/g.114584 Transcript_50934/m.114584 type:complete len:189 (+) Transcript_50934:55-621(+)
MARSCIGATLIQALQLGECNRETALGIVRKDGRALQWMGSSLQSDQEIVLAAVLQYGRSLEHAGAICKSDRNIVQAALNEDSWALQYAADELLADDSFAIETKSSHFILKVSMLSGRSCYSCVKTLQAMTEPAASIIRRCCERLGLEFSGREVLVHGSDVVPIAAPLLDWPGLNGCGMVTEYQLVVEV